MEQGWGDHQATGNRESPGRAPRKPESDLSPPLTLTSVSISIFACDVTRYLFVSTSQDSQNGPWGEGEGSPL